MPHEPTALSELPDPDDLGGGRFAIDKPKPITLGEARRAWTDPSGKEPPIDASDCGPTFDGRRTQ